MTKSQSHIKFTFIAIGMIVMSSFYSQTTVHCYAPQFKGQIARMTTYVDYLTFEKKELAKGIVDSTGHITFVVSEKQSQKAFIDIQDKSGTIYLDNNTPEYFVNFPYQHENVQKLSDNTVQMVFDSLQHNDLNALILEFNIQLDYFLYGDTAKVQRLMLQNSLFRDSLGAFTEYIFNDYKDQTNIYFKNYMRYSIADVALYSNRQEPAKNKLVVFETFIKSRPILYKNEAYMTFIKNFYKDCMSDIAMIDRDKATTAVNTLQDFSRFSDVFSTHYYLSNATFSEFIMIISLSEAYHTTFYDRLVIRNFLNYIAHNGKFPSHKIMANNVLAVQEKLQIGNPVPKLNWISPQGDSLSLSDFKGKYVYLGFWATWNPQSVQDIYMTKILEERYDKHIEFVSISIDNLPFKYEDFLTKNRDQKLDWNFGHYMGDSQVLEDFEIRSAPSYFLIDPSGNLIQSPAYSPSPNGTYESIDETFHNIAKKLDPKRTIRIGSAEN
ncbi:MAG: peroxiredoxin [Flavobacteriales bacterium]|jgi:peroxiredoxin